MKIDVIMITKNALQPCLKESIKSIFQNVPVNQLIIVDSFSSDGTINFLRKLSNKDIKIIQKECKRGKAREIGIKEVKTAWFAFIDADVVLDNDWFRKIIKHVNQDIGAIEANVKTPLGNVQKIRSTGRAYTNSTIIRTKSVKNIKIPKEMSVYEDQYIRKHIEKSGFKWLKVSNPCSVHYSTSNRFNDAYEIGRMSGKYRLFPFKIHLLSFFIVSAKKLLGKPVSPMIHWNMVLGHIRGIFER